MLSGAIGFPLRLDGGNRERNHFPARPAQVKSVNENGRNEHKTMTGSHPPPASRQSAQRAPWAQRHDSGLSRCDSAGQASRLSPSDRTGNITNRNPWTTAENRSRGRV